MANEEFFRTFMVEVQRINTDNMAAIMLANNQSQAQQTRSHQEAMEAMLNKITDMKPPPSTHHNMVDTRGIGKPSTFRGDEMKFAEWSSKLEAFLKVTESESNGMLSWACNLTEHVDDDLIDETFQVSGPVKQFSAALQAILVTHTEDEAWRIVDSAKDFGGLEAYRLLKRRYAPKTAGTKRAMLKAIINNPQCKSVHLVESNLMKLEDLIKKYENMTETRLPEDLKVTVLIDLCHKDLREHLEMSTKDLPLKEVREEILNYIERKRSTFAANNSAMELDHFDDYQDEWQEEEQYWDPYAYWPPPEELNWLGKGKSKGKGKGYKGKGMQFSYSKGKGKEKGGGQKGKGKGFQGDCYWCGTYGHSASRCVQKDQYMQNLRSSQGMPEPGAGGKGAVYNMEPNTAPTQPNPPAQFQKAMDSLEQNGRRRMLASVEVHNKFRALGDDDDGEEPMYVSPVSGSRTLTRPLSDWMTVSKKRVKQNAVRVRSDLLVRPASVPAVPVGKQCKQCNVMELSALEISKTCALPSTCTFKKISKEENKNNRSGKERKQITNPCVLILKP